MYLPGNAWYLANVLYADQMVIFFVMLFILLEYVIDVLSNNKLKFFMRIFKFFIIYFGILTDYYFWIFVFLAFLLKAIKNILCKERTWPLVVSLAEYVCPVIAEGAFQLLGCG